MARKGEVELIPEVYALDGIPLPRQRANLIGHGATEFALLNAYRSDRLHHAWILGGPKGIGKATLAFRFAKYVIAHPDRFGSVVAEASDLSLPADDPVFRQVQAGGHPNILHLRRPWDDKGKRFKADLPVDEVRKTVSFFGTTASARAWRVCIVDSADEMNANSANALLKILEEPPAQCLFLVLSHAPGRLLPTIRSRCRRLDMAPLQTDELEIGLNELAPGQIEDRSHLEDLTHFADGSLRSALTLLSGDGLAITRGFVGLAAAAPSIDVPALHGLSDLVSARGQEDNWQSFQHIARTWVHSQMREDTRVAARNLLFWTQLWDRINASIRETDALNLDRKQVVLDFFFQLAKRPSTTA
ncbi:DNA polymerase-3 subunit delta' [Roseibium hamelinense]|uniref:DNA polymerase-3 subunit delta n=1 Tax=Roseibium hamelinense TaxID=150831 RepID=A0A562THZ1_9HYPH|nr:DNA polymerase III subunit delta' [Roseibium hamelinense]MTI45835.1 DNA polymerase III subunit delta' [Roseibium hamelinense]TWI92983.1 DNA polymerase-3 subunit delta' [Roseibium hamelinense]